MSPLHQAVVEDNFEQLTNLSFVKKWENVPDKLGFTPLEIGKFLGKYQAVKLLGAHFSSSFKLQINGLHRPVELSLEGFEKALGIIYRPYLTFSSYDLLKQVVNNCPYILRNSALASDNYEWAKIYQKELSEGKTAPIGIKWIDDLMGYGAFAAENLPSGSFVGEYTGVVRRLFRRKADQNPYCFHYPTKLWSLKYFLVDSLYEGNLTRFINHSSSPNLEPFCLVDRQVLHQIFITRRFIKQDEQLTFDYGKDYWTKRSPLDHK